MRPSVWAPAHDAGLDTPAELATVMAELEALKLSKQKQQAEIAAVKLESRKNREKVSVTKPPPHTIGRTQQNMCLLGAATGFSGPTPRSSR